MKSVNQRLYPELQAGGFARDDHRVTFFARENALLPENATVLEFGAGRGKFAEVETGWKRALTHFKGKAAHVIGVDPDPIVMQNPDLDEAHSFVSGEPLPVADASIDIITSWAVFEHVEQAEFYAREMERVLKPGGWITAWTPNKWGYVGIGARLIPNAWHVRLLKVLSPGRAEMDTFPTFYRLNTRGALKALFPSSRFQHCTYVFNGPPGYTANSILIAQIWRTFDWIMPSSFGQALHIFIQKQP